MIPKRLFSSPLFQNLAYTYRFGTLPMIKKEGLSEHITQGILLGISVYSEINSTLDKSVQYPIKDFIVNYAIHDVGEPLTAEINLGFKYSCPKLSKLINSKTDEAVLKYVKSHHSIEAAQLILDLFGSPTSSIDSYYGYKYIDILQVAYYLFNEVFKLNNSNAIPTFLNCKRNLMTFIESIDYKKLEYKEFFTALNEYHQQLDNYLQSHIQESKESCTIKHRLFSDANLITE